MLLFDEAGYDVKLDINAMELQFFDKRLNEGKIGFVNFYYDLWAVRRQLVRRRIAQLPRENQGQSTAKWCHEYFAHYEHIALGNSDQDVV